jgi:hypothetical protein
MSEIAAEAAQVAGPAAPPTGSGGPAATIPRAAEQAARIAWQWRRAPATDERAEAAAAARKKGLLGGVIGLAVAAALYFWKPQMALVVVSIAVLTTLLALVSPLGAFRALTRALEAFARGVGLVLTWLLMALAYYLLFLPVGLLLRLAGKLHVTRGADAHRTSYWEPAKATAPGIDTYRRSF